MHSSHPSNLKLINQIVKYCDGGLDGCCKVLSMPAFFSSVTGQSLDPTLTSLDSARGQFPLVNDHFSQRRRGHK